MKKHVKLGLLYLLVGFFCVYWAQAHSPKAGLGSIIGNELSGSYTLSETWYYGTLAVGAVLAVMGVLKFIKK